MPIDWNQDKERAVEANFTQAANERRFQHTTYGKSQWDVMQKKVESGRQYIESDVEAKYQLLKQAQADYIQALGEYELAAANANAAERRFQLGMVSKNQCQEEQKGAGGKTGCKGDRRPVIQAGNGKLQMGCQWPGPGRGLGERRKEW